VQADAIACPIAQQDHRGTQRDHLVDLLDQRHMEVFRTMAFLTVAYEPAQRQGATFLDHVDHQGEAATSHRTTSDHFTTGHFS
jgi:hypothetical protein